MRSVTDAFLINGQPMLAPDAEVTVSYEDIDGADAGRDQAGFLHRSLLRCKVPSWNFSYTWLTEEEKHRLGGYNMKEITLGVRPEDITEGNDIAVKVFSNENLGMNTLVHGHMGEGLRVTAKLRGWAEYRPGDEVCVSFGRKHFFDKVTTNAIRGEE